jgi:hypothetical protein
MAMLPANRPRLVQQEYPVDWMLAYATLKGYYHAIVECPDGHQYEVTFYDDARAYSHLYHRTQVGKPWYSQPSLVIVDQVTEEVTEEVLAALWEEGWFSYLEPVGDASVSPADASMDSCTVEAPREAAMGRVGSSQLELVEGTSERELDDGALKGCLTTADAVCPDGHRYRVSFLQPIVLSRILELRALQRKPWIAETGLIVVGEVSRPLMESALGDLWATGWFQHFKSVGTWAVK